MSKTYVFHHDDLDGIASSLILQEYYFNVKCFSCNYESNMINPLDIIKKDDVVIIVDYSFSPEIMKKLFLFLKNNLVWLDHHISAIENSKKYKYDKIRGIRDIRYCGTELSWEWCKPNKKAPLLIKTIGDFDTFRTFGTKDQKKAFNIFYGIKSYDNNVLVHAIKNCYYEGIDENNKWYDYFYKSGEIIYNYNLNEYKEYGDKNSYIRNIFGLKVLCMNTYHGGLCLQLPKIYNPKEHDIILTYYYNGEEWNYGFYTDVNFHPEIDCSKIAMMYDGGGHKGAAGARSKELIKGLL